MTDQNCGNCRWADIPMTGGKRPRPVRGEAGSCLYPIPELPAMPESVIGFYPPHKGGIWPDFGTNCPTWEKRS